MITPLKLYSEVQQQQTVELLDKLNEVIDKVNALEAAIDMLVKKPRCNDTETTEIPE